MPGIAILVISAVLLAVYLRRYTTIKQAAVILLAVYALVVTTYAAGSYYFYHVVTGYHGFDPYYQVPPPQFDVAMAKDSNEFRIITLGGSTTRDPRVDEKQNYPYLLQQMLQAKYPTKKITVLNGGMNWYSSKHTLMYYTEYAHLYHPDLVIVMDGINDLYRSFSPIGFAWGDYKPDYSHFYGAAIRGAITTTFEHEIYNRDNDEIESYTRAKVPFSKFKAIGPYKTYESSLANYIRKDSVQCLLIMQPSLYQTGLPDSMEEKLWFGKFFCNMYDHGNKIFPDGASMKTAMDSFINATRQVAIEQNCMLLNADSAMPKNLDYLTDDVHYTNKGAQTLARLVYDKIISEKIISK